jgi:hypothetical protein
MNSNVLFTKIGDHVEVGRCGPAGEAGWRASRGLKEIAITRPAFPVVKANARSTFHCCLNRESDLYSSMA